METADVTRQKIEKGTNPKGEQDYRDHYLKSETQRHMQMRTLCVHY